MKRKRLREAYDADVHCVARVGALGDITRRVDVDGPENVVSSCKYTAANFLVKSLLLQFRRVGNVYFLVVTVIMLLGLYTDLFQSSLTPWGQLMMLVLILSFNMLSEGVDDLKRHFTDKATNNQECWALGTEDEEDLSLDASNVGWKSVKWRDLKRGHILRVDCNDKVPADVLLLSTGQVLNDPSAYLETSDIDGETFLKRKFTLPRLLNAFKVAFDAQGSVEEAATSKDLSSARVVAASLRDASMVYAAPNPSLGSFQGRICLNKSEDPIPFSADNVLLRGSKLRNTTYALGIVLMTGKDTKMLLADTGAPNKYSRVDSLTNQIIATVLLCLAVLVAFSAGMHFSPIFIPSDDLWYMAFTKESVGEVFPAWLSLILQYVILYKNILPILLYGVQEALAQLQCYFIQNDLEMYCEELNHRAKCNTTNLVQEIGQIDWIFSDKTGTLTRNEMRLVGCSVQNRVFGCVTAGAVQNLDQAGDDSSSVVRSALGDLVSYISTEKAAGDEAVQRFLRALVLCHTVLVESGEEDDDAKVGDSTAKVRKGDIVLARQESEKNFELPAPSLTSGPLKYNAESPDEKALLEGAAAVGAFTLVATEGNSTLVVCNNFNKGEADEEGHPTLENWQVLAVNSFSSKRKRMSLLLREPSGERRILLICKGADNQMLNDEVAPADVQSSDMEETKEALGEFAAAGLRTLVYGQRYVSEEEFFGWKQSYDDACSCAEPKKRQALLHEVACAMEKGLQVIGVTCVEDRLQERVGETIRLVRDAGIKLWVITGDKVETAVTIGFSTSLLDDETSMIYLVPKKGVVPLAEKDIIFNKEAPAEMVSADDVRNEVKRLRRLLENQIHVSGTVQSALIVDGAILDVLLSDTEDENKADENEDVPIKIQFLELAKLCNVVLACRASPAQKAALVTLVRYCVEPMPRTLAIGDGSNDVPMLYAAHVGVGIQGKEGTLAVSASDFAIAKFRFLANLMFVHGRLGYLRIANVIGLIFYGNFLLTFATFLYSCLSMFSGTAFFPDSLVTLFNFFVAVPVLGLGAFDRDFLPIIKVLEVPRAYDLGRRKLILNTFNYDIQMMRGGVHCAFAFLVLFYENIYTSQVALSQQFYLFLIVLLTFRQLLTASTFAIPFAITLLLNFVVGVAIVCIINLANGEYLVLFQDYARALWFAMVSVIGFVELFDFFASIIYRAYKSSKDSKDFAANEQIPTRTLSITSHPSLYLPATQSSSAQGDIELPTRRLEASNSNNDKDDK